MTTSREDTSGLNLLHYGEFTAPWRRQQRRRRQGRKRGGSSRTRCRTNCGQQTKGRNQASNTNPADELDEVGVEGDAGLGVEDGGLGRADKVGRDNLIISVAEVEVSILFRTSTDTHSPKNALVLGALRGLLDDLLDLVVRGRLLKSDNKVDD